MLLSPGRSREVDAITRLIARLFFGTTAGLGLGGVLMILALPTPMPMPPAWRDAAALQCLGYAVASALALWRSQAPRFPVGRALFLAGLLTLANVVGLCIWLTDGLQGPLLGFLPVLVCMHAAIAGPRAGAWMGAAAALGLAALAGLHLQGFPRPLDGRLVSMLLLGQALVLIGAYVAGGLLSQVIVRLLAAADERERRFRSLLDIGVDWYWEQDAEYRFTLISRSRDADLQPPPDHLHAAPWEISDFGLEPARLDAHRADLEAHRRFDNLPLERRDARGRVRHLQVSGEPRFAPDGSFRGYWGVVRDVTLARRAQEAITISELRYRTLFAFSPSPLLLLRGERVLDANEAAAHLLGHPHREAIVGLSLLEHMADAAGREALRGRSRQAEALAIGQSLPTVDQEMLTLDGRRIAVQSTGVCIAAASGPATLTILVDITARKATEAALRRSQAMLSHLFETSPDCLTLTDIETGRYTLVNQGFCDAAGWSRSEVIGRTAQDLGIWWDPSDRERVIAAIRTHGRIHNESLSFRRRDGLRLPMLVSAAPLQFEGRALLVLLARDVSRSEQARLELQAILDTVSLAIAFVRGDRIVRVNARFRAMFGEPAPAADGAEPTLAMLWPDRAAYEAVRRRATARLRRHQAFERETPLRGRDGRPVWCRVQARPVDPADPAAGTIWSAEDVTQRREFERTLAAARDAAEAASRAKSVFLANTSHEIRTPLNGLLGLARLAMEPELPAARRQLYLHQIHDSAQSLTGIISDILDLSKIEAGKIELEQLPFALHELLASVHHGYAALAEAKGLVLALEIEPGLPTHVRGDPLRVRQILTNLVANAIKFTEHGEVRIEAAPWQGRVLLTVHDTGPGLDAAARARLFQPFSQADGSTTRRYGGTGLGLSICRELAGLMGGEVGVDSEPGDGSHFWAALPLPAVAAPGAGGDGATVDVARLHGKRVLVAEDHPVNMLIAVAMLESWGLVVTQAADGAEALDRLFGAAPGPHDPPPVDLVLMDLHMPELGGVEAVARIRERWSAEQLPVMALTAAAMIGERDEALAAGMNDFLTKPVDAQKLRAALLRQLAATAATA